MADGLGLDLPEPAQAAKPTIELPPSPKLSILGNAPKDFKGRKMGILLTDGSSAELFAALTKALDAEGSLYEVVAPKIGGVTLDDGTKVAAQQKIDGGPSVLYDAVAVLPSEAGVAMLAKDATAKDFVADAFAHCKFIGHTEAAATLFQAAGVTEPDDGFIALAKAKDAKGFIVQCRSLRFWARELRVDLDAAALKAPA